MEASDFENEFPEKKLSLVFPVNRVQMNDDVKRHIRRDPTNHTINLLQSRKDITHSRKAID